MQLFELCLLFFVLNLERRRLSRPMVEPPPLGEPSQQALPEQHTALARRALQSHRHCGSGISTLFSLARAARPKGPRHPHPVTEVCVAEDARGLLAHALLDAFKEPAETDAETDVAEKHVSVRGRKDGSVTRGEEWGERTKRAGGGARGLILEGRLRRYSSRDRSGGGIGPLLTER